MPSGPGTALRAIGICLRAGAALLVASAVFLLVPIPELRPAQIDLALAIQAIEPSTLRGLLVIDTSAGCAVRGDFLLCAVALLLLDWVVGRASRTTRGL